MNKLKVWTSHRLGVRMEGGRGLRDLTARLIGLGHFNLGNTVIFGH